MGTSAARLSLILITIGYLAAETVLAERGRHERKALFSSLERIVAAADLMLWSEDNPNLFTGRVSAAFLGHPYREVLNLSPFQSSGPSGQLLRTRLDPEGKRFTFYRFRTEEADYPGPAAGLTVYFAEARDVIGDLPFFLFNHRKNGYATLSVPSAVLADLAIPKSSYLEGPIDYLKNFAVRTAKLEDDKSLTVVPYSSLAAAVVSGAAEVTDRTYSADALSQAFGDLYAANQQEPSLLGLQIRRTRLAILLPVIFVGASFALLHRVRRLHGIEDDRDPWILLNPRDRLERGVWWIYWSILLVTPVPLFAVALLAAWMPSKILAIFLTAGAAYGIACSCNCLLKLKQAETVHEQLTD